MLKAKCIKGTYTYKNEQHRFLDVNVGDERLFEFFSESIGSWDMLKKLTKIPI